MNLFKSVLLLLSLWSFTAPALAQVAGESCTAGLESNVSLLNTALHNIYSFNYVRKAMAELQKSHPGAQFCVSGLAVARDVYQYPEFYIQVRVRAAGKSVHEMRFLFQDASTQALDNIGDKPWIGLPMNQSELSVKTYVSRQTLAPIFSTDGSFDVLSIAKQSATYRTSPSIDQATLSTMPLQITDLQEYYIVSWLTEPGANPFASVVTLKAVLISRNPKSGVVSLTENLWLTQDLIIPFETMLNNYQVPESERTQALLGSRIPFKMAPLSVDKKTVSGR